MTMYCVKCRAKRDVGKFETLTAKMVNRLPDAICPVCGTKMFKIVELNKLDQENRPDDGFPS